MSPHCFNGGLNPRVSLYQPKNGTLILKRWHTQMLGSEKNFQASRSGGVATRAVRVSFRKLCRRGQGSHSILCGRSGPLSGDKLSRSSCVCSLGWRICQPVSQLCLFVCLFVPLFVLAGWFVLAPFGFPACKEQAMLVV